MKKFLLLTAASLALTLGSMPALAKERPAPPKNLENLPNKVALAKWPKAKAHKANNQEISVNKVNPLAQKFAKAEGATKSQAFKCALIYSYAWDDDYPLYGAYTFDASDVNTMTRKYLNTEYPANAGGYFTDEGKFVYTSYVMDDWGWDYEVKTYVIDTTTWSVEKTIDQGSLYAMATDLAYDPIEKVAFGAFYSGDDDTTVWGYMDPANEYAVTQIATIDGSLVAVAANAQGEVYGFTSGGYLVKIDKYSGTLTTIGYTTVAPADLQSAAFSEDGTLYWAAMTSGGGSGLFTVDTATGAVSLVGQFDDDQEVVALYAEPTAADAGAPAEPTNLALKFVEDALTGTVSFDVPELNNLGETMTGDVTYIISVDSDDALTGTTAVGQTANVSVTVPSAGIHSISVRLKNDNGESRRVSASQWIGIDRPVAVSDLVMTKTDALTAHISWTAPTKGALDGYFDPERITYTVTRMPEGTVVASKLKATSFDDVMTNTDKVYVTYKVTPYADDVEGAAAVSNGAIFGESLNVPVQFTFETEADYNIFTVIDNNETLNLDSGMWEYSPSGQCAGYVSGTKDGDDWLITPEIKLYADRQYSFSYQTLCYSQSWPDEYELYMGTDATIEAMTTQLVEPTTIYWEDYRTTTLTITVPADGTYNFGFHALSEAGGAFFLVDNIELSESYKLKAPQKVDNLQAVAGDLGAMNATVSFNAPTKAVDGTDLTAISKITVERYGDVIKTFEAPELGAQLSFFDDSEDLEQGNVTYKVVASNESGDGVEAEVTVWVGFDLPCAPAKISSKIVDNNPVITWEAPQARGQNGGYVDFSNMTYIVYRVNDQEILESSYTAFSYTDEEVTITDEGDQSIWQYGVFARNSQGIGDAAAAYVIDGESYDMPFTESFAKGTTNQLWLSSGTLDDYWKIADDWSADPQDSDKGLLLLTPATPGSVSKFLSGKINMEGSKNPTMSFYLCAMTYTDNEFAETDPADDYLEVVAAGSDYEFKTLKTIYPNDLEKGNYLKQTVDLADFANDEYAMVGFIMHNVAAQSPIALDNIRVASNFDVNLKLDDFTVPATVNVTEALTATVKVTNDAATDANNFTVKVKRGDEVVATTTETEALAAGESRSYSMDITATPAWEETETLVAEVAIDGDEYAADNTKEAEVAVWRPDMPVVADLAFDLIEPDCEDGVSSVTFTWSAPEISTFAKVEESFESYEHGSLRNVGDWTLTDEDQCYGVDDITAGGEYIDIPHPFARQSFMVFNPEEAGIDLNAAPEWASHSGNQMMVNFRNWDAENDDWMISPKLSGNAQTVTFWARSPKANKDRIIFYTSKTDTEVSSFSRHEDGRISLTTEWTQYSFEVEEGTLYFAIRNNQDACECVMVDDVAFEAGAAMAVVPEVQGYNLYCNDAKVNADLLTQTAYSAVVADLETGTYYVTVVYNVGESDASNTVYVDLSGIENVSVDALNNNAPTYDVYGRRVTNLLPGQIYLQPGKKFVNR
jgi:hypothetical protein